MAARRGCALWLKSVAIRCELRAVAEKRGYGLRAVSCGSKGAASYELGLQGADGRCG